MLAAIPATRTPKFPEIDAVLRTTGANAFNNELVLRDRTYGDFTTLAAAKAALGKSSTGDARAALALMKGDDGHFFGQSIKQTWNEGPDTWRNHYDPIELEGKTSADFGKLIVDENSGIVGLIDGATFVKAHAEKF